MKTKIANLGRSFCTLSLLFVTGMAFALPNVESHSRSGWVSAAPSGDPVENPTLELLRKVEFLQQEVSELRGKVEEQNHRLDQLKNNQHKLYLDLDKRLQNAQPKAPESASSGINIDVTPSSEPLSPAAFKSGQANNVALAEEKAYQQAYHLVQNKDYEGARQSFRSLIKTFPEGKYVPNANYWLGEIYMAKGELDLAAGAFDTVYRHYPQHPKAADSLLKLGYVEYAKGQWKHSQKLLAEVKNQYPNSTSAQLAEARLQRMQKEGRL